MNKRITSLLICFVMVFAMLATAVPALAAPITSTQLKVIPDKTTASPGETITYTIIMGPVSDMGSMQMVLDIPTGLTYVENSAKLTDGLRTTLGFDTADWTEVSKMVNGVASAADYESATDTELAKFQCKVDDGATGSLEVGLTNLEFGSCQTFEYHTDRFSVVKTPVTITAAPKPATGISLNKTATTIYTGNTETLIATVEPTDTTDTVVWTSSKESVATVDNTGKVTAVAPGTATITAKAGDKTATCTVTVENAPCTHTSKTPIPAKASTCEEKGWDAYQKCEQCGKLFDTNGNPIDGIPYRALDAAAHDFNTSEWGYKEADGHAHVCRRNPAHHDTVVAHTAGPAATETTPQTCTECGFVMQPATGHVHADHLTKVDKKDATCTADGNKEYYRCTCGKLFEDAAAATEITDHSSVVLPKTGHSYTVQKSDEAHKRSTAADCREFDTYWYTCANDETHSAKDDAAAADKFYNGEQGAHVYGNEWVDRGEAGHAHKCQYHDAYDEVQPHTPDHEGGATYEYAVKCTECGRVLEPQLEAGDIRIEVPFKLTVKKTGEMDPGKETFKFVVERFGAPVEYVLVQDTVETEGEKTYDGKFIFTIGANQAGNLSEGFIIRQVKGNAEGWTYDETKFYAMPMFADTYTNVASWRFLKYDENAELDYNSPIEEISFTNSYNAKKPVTPPAPQPTPQPETPDTGDSSMTVLWIALLFVSGATLMGTTLYSRKKRVNNH